MKRNSDQASCCARGRRRAFAKGFFITLAVLLPVYIFAVFWAACRNSEAQQELQAALPAPKAEVIPQAYNLHLMLQTQQGQLMGSVLLRFDAAQRQVQLVTLPAQTVLLYRRHTVCAGELFETLGSMALQQAVEETLGTAVSGWCCVRPAQLQTDTQSTGTLTLRLPQEAAELSVQQLPQLFAAAQTPQAYAELLHSAAAAVLLALPADGLQEDILQWYEQLPPLQGNIDAAGIHALARAAAACVGGGFELADAYAGGSWNTDGQFVLADGSDTALQLRFGKAQ